MPNFTLQGCMKGKKISPSGEKVFSNWEIIFPS